MEIALVAPLYESVPPRLYGGTERVVYWLAEALIDLGHDVTLYASGDSKTRARLIPCSEQALRLDQDRHDFVSAHFLQLEQVVADAAQYDVIHFHTDTFHFPFLRRIHTPTVSTLHGRVDLKETHQLFHELSEANYIFISESQRAFVPPVSWQTTILHGMPKDILKFNPKSEGYLAFLGRISPEKGVHRAVEIARRTGKKLKIAAKVDLPDQPYYQTIAHLFEEPFVEFVGEISDHEKSDFLGGADALLFPIDWPEPFGLVMIESCATGTPVIAYPLGSVPEIIQDGQNGFIVRSIDEAVAAVHRLPQLSRKLCRIDFETRFSAERMARDHVRAYETLRFESDVIPTPRILRKDTECLTDLQ